MQRMHRACRTNQPQPSQHSTTPQPPSNPSTHLRRNRKAIPTPHLQIIATRTIHPSPIQAKEPLHRPPLPASRLPQQRPARIARHDGAALRAPGREVGALAGEAAPADAVVAAGDHVGAPGVKGRVAGH